MIFIDAVKREEFAIYCIIIGANTYSFLNNDAELTIFVFDKNIDNSS